MTRRILLLLAVMAFMVGLAGIAAPRKPERLLLLDWANKGTGAPPPVAILLELGVKDEEPRAWNGKATLKGGQVVHREGYRFRPAAGDKLVEPDSWVASSHRAIRLPPRQPAVAKMEPLATVGIVLHIANLKPDAALTIASVDKELPEASVPVAELLSGQPRALWEGRAVARRITAATPVANSPTEDDFPAASYGPDGTLWLAYISYTVKDDSRRIEQKPLKKQPENFKEFLTPEFGDQLYVKFLRGGKLSEPIAVTEGKQDLARCAIAAAGDGKVWAVYSARRAGTMQICARQLAEANSKVTVGQEVRISNTPGPHLGPVACSTPAGDVLIAWQAWQPEGGARIAVTRLRQGAATVAEGDSVIPADKSLGRQWYPSVAAGPGGIEAVASDAYNGDSYDIVLARGSGRKGPDGAVKGSLQVTGSRKFEARPSVAFDPQGRLWIAYEEGPEGWGKDYGALGENDGNPLYSSRSIRVVCMMEDGAPVYKEPVAALPISNVAAPKIPYGAQGPAYERAVRYAYPQLGIDGMGRLWLAYRQKFGSRFSSHPGSYWLTYVRRLDGDRWTDPIEVHHSDGLLDHRPVLLPHHSGGLAIVHNTDGRFATPERIDNQVYLSLVDLPGEPADPPLKVREEFRLDAARTLQGREQFERQQEEQQGVQRMRDYRYEVGGKTYRPLRGEFHRHTEISWDGGPDGSLEDMFRYAIDAARMDWIGNGDHDSGGGREYSWWLIQKLTDAYHVKESFTPMFTYERSVAYPHGHRNCMFVQRGVRTLPRLEETDPDKRVATVHADDTKMLYRYLREHNGVCASHTSATSMGTDWRDNDPMVEPIVEIYQGDRMSYEHEGAPRAGFDPKTGKEPANVAGWFPAGFIDKALGKGHRLGFQASSDHWSTHISYCVVLAERPDRAAILEAIQKRHVYGATDDIVVDVRSGNAMMGDELRTNAAPALQVRIVGTGPLAGVDVMKDSKVAATLKPDGGSSRDLKQAWTDPNPTAGSHYYYVRVRQDDGQLAWSSPIWIHKAD